MLVASIVGVDMRATMDIDTTVKALPLNEKDARAIIERIGELQLEDVHEDDSTKQIDGFIGLNNDYIEGGARI